MIESLLAVQVKEWKFAGATRDAGGGATLEYRLRLRKSVSAESVVQVIRSRLGTQATGVEAR